MISAFKKIWTFSLNEQKNIKKSLLFVCLNAIFNAFQLIAVYYVLTRIFSNSINYMDCLIIFLIMIFSAIGKVMCQNKSQLQQTHAGYFMSAEKRIYIGEKIKKVPMGFFSTFNLGKLTNLTTTNLSQIEMWVPLLLVMVLGGFFTTFIFILFLLFFSFKIGVIALCGMLMFLYISSLMERKSIKNATEMQGVQSTLTENVLSVVQGMQVIKSYNLYGEKNKKLNQSFSEACEKMLDIEKTLIPYLVIQRISIAITISIIIYCSITMHLHQQLSLVNTIMSLIASFVIFEELISAGSSLSYLRTTENAIDSLEYIDSIPCITEGTYDKTNANYDINFNNVSFSYDEKEILKNVSCNIEEKSMTAIIGPSGSGKSTFCNLIARFWDVNSGVISIGGIDIKEYSLASLMEQISMVFQNVYLFEDTIENNIKFGSPHATREDVIKASKAAMCHEFIMKLPNEYDTLIGEAGANLSGGEKQRISIARALLKDSPIIILDEATANVDPENETKLKLAIEKLTENKTVIMIAHQLSTIINANQIIVLKDGKIIQNGTHDELIKKDGLYKKLIEFKKEAVNWKVVN